MEYPDLRAIARGRHSRGPRGTRQGPLQFRPPIALRTDLSHVTTELWEIRNVEDGALILDMIN